MTADRQLSIIELFREMLEEDLGADVPGGIVVGPATNDQQQLGVIQLMSAGLPRKEAYAPLLWQRVQIRCVAGSLIAADTLAGLVMVREDNRNRRVVTQDSNGHAYLVHWVSVESGPSGHFDSPTTWETLLFAEVMVGTVPVA